MIIFKLTKPTGEILRCAASIFSFNLTINLIFPRIFCVGRILDKSIRGLLICNSGFLDFRRLSEDCRRLIDKAIKKKAEIIRK
jgi:hypothetical protein